MSGLLLRLAGALQSWGERSAFTHRDTAAFPTRSGLTGMFAAAEGRDRFHDPGIYADLTFTVRIDRPGERLTDYHTIGGGLKGKQTVVTSSGQHKGAAVISRREYLSDAVFVVAATGPDETITRLADALEHPHWAPYLGRRACVPDEPLLLRSNIPDPVTQLRTTVPLSPPHTGPDPLPHAPSTNSEESVSVDFLWEHPPHEHPEQAAAIDIADMPESFTPHQRRHSLRRLYRTSEPLPARLVSCQTKLHRHLLDYCLGTPA